MARAVKTPKTNAMRELESADISYVLHTDKSCKIYYLFKHCLLRI